MRPGFTLIELLIGIAISSLVLGVLLQSLTQMSRTARRVDELADSGIAWCISEQVLENDISGIFIPRQAQQGGDLVATSTGAKESKDAKDADDKPLEKIFYGAQNGAGTFDVLTFITNNPLQVYGQSKPRIARVVYRLQEQPDQKGHFMLMRQESSELKFAQFGPDASKKIRAYPLLDNITSCKVAYYEQEPSKDEPAAGAPAKPGDKTAAKEKKPQKITYRTVKEWKRDKNPDDKQAATKDEKKQESQRLPNFIEFTITTMDITNATERTYILMMGIPQPLERSKPAAPATTKTPSPAAPAKASTVKPTTTVSAVGKTR